MRGGDGMAFSLQSFVNTGRSSHATSSARMPALATTALTSIVQSAIACDSRQRPRHAETRWAGCKAHQPPPSFNCQSCNSLKSRPLSCDVSLERDTHKPCKLCAT